MNKNDFHQNLGGPIDYIKNIAYETVEKNADIYFVTFDNVFSVRWHVSFYVFVCLNCNLICCM